MRFTFIANNSLSVSPKDTETRFIFAPYLRQSPYTSVPPEQLSVNIALARGSLDASSINPDRVYSAFIKGAEIWWDSYSDIKDLIITLESEELEQRNAEVLNRAGVNSVYPIYTPHMVLAFDIPNSTSRNRWWTNQVIEDFNTKHKGKLIRLTNEELNSTSGVVPTNPNDQLIIDQPTL